MASFARDPGLTPAQLAIVWVRAKGAAQSVTVIPTMGARTRAQLADALSGLDVTLGAAEIAALESTIPATGISGFCYRPLYASAGRSGP